MRYEWVDAEGIGYSYAERITDPGSRPVLRELLRLAEENRRLRETTEEMQEIITAGDDEWNALQAFCRTRFGQIRSGETSMSMLERVAAERDALRAENRRLSEALQDDVAALCRAAGIGDHARPISVIRKLLRDHRPTPENGQ